MRFALLTLCLSLCACVSTATPETISITQRDGATTVTVTRPGMAEQAAEGAVGGVIAGIGKLFAR